MGVLTRPVRASGNFEAREMGVPGPLLIAPRVFRDGRGFFLETWSERASAAPGVAGRFARDSHSFSAAACTVRGMRLQPPPRARAKPVRVPRGAVLGAVVDLQRGSPACGRHATVGLSAAGARRVHAPASSARGFRAAEPGTGGAHKASDRRDPGLARGLAQDESGLALPWPLTAGRAVLSDEDRRQPRLRDLAL